MKLKMPVLVKYKKISEMKEISPNYWPKAFRYFLDYLEMREKSKNQALETLIKETKELDDYACVAQIEKFLKQFDFPAYQKYMLKVYNQKV
ncbi:hypothetical protein J7L36_01365 [bacterium]|nr:hypothetical protein [bacterium]